MPPAAFFCCLPCVGGLEGEGRGTAICPGGSLWSWKLAGDIGAQKSHPHK